MPMSAREKEWATKASRYVKARLKQADVGYKELADRLKSHGLEETEAGIASKLSRGTFSATFLLSVLAVLELEGIRLEDL